MNKRYFLGVFSILLLAFLGNVSAKPKWKLRIPTSVFSIKDLWLSTNAFDQGKNIVYAYGRGHIFSIHLNDNHIDSIPWKGKVLFEEKFTLDKTGNRLIFGNGGMQEKFAVDLSTGEINTYSKHRDDEESHFAALYWNEKKQRLGFFGGYGIYKVKNWAFEYDSLGNWITVHSNIDNCNPPKRTHANLILGHPDKPHLYVLSGYGNCSGDQLEQQCVNGISQFNDVGSWCWLRDLFLYDYEQHTFTQIIGPHEESMIIEGKGAYDFNNNVMYVVGGRKPILKENRIVNESFKNIILKFRIGRDKQFKVFETDTKLLKQSSIHEEYNSCPFYNPKQKSLIWFRSDGIWELPLE